MEPSVLCSSAFVLLDNNSPPPLSPKPREALQSCAGKIKWCLFDLSSLMVFEMKISDCQIIPCKLLTVATVSDLS